MYEKIISLQNRNVKSKKCKNALNKIARCAKIDV